MLPVDEHLKKKLLQREEEGSLRSLSHQESLVDFCSNDYLGFARSAELQKLIANIKPNGDSRLIGSTGSRLLTGNSMFVEELEVEIASFHKAEAGLIFNSGYDANIGFYSAVPQRGDTIIVDELVHASIRDGARLSRAEIVKFRHNDLDHLREQLKVSSGTKYVAIESVYSMDGDLAPLNDLVVVCEDFKANY